ncbi:FAD-dependent oxidoreductase [[Mycobacterium] nativiensis]|uniref:FAD-dependent oxidoreductase n=1 Tax=[Mycobacterium] nativiensis TaxID=2855503 RepID=A0ABU5XUY8_9MYCO|nr:FAD-dependent oxidoreductase [Mycolicibacter sp. MYC340]MEB3031804.1 FAD-dependent oxidoreductase [Mycolicibacter sp. MYC340]
MNVTNGSKVDTADVIVVGAGLGGLCTAVAARERGLSVTVLEKSELVGGAAAYSGGQVWVGANHVQRRLGLDDSPQRVEEYVRALAASHPELLDEDIMRRWIDISPIAAEYYEKIGAVQWDAIVGFPDYYTEKPGACLSGRYLTATYDASDLGEWAGKLRLAPTFPVGMTYPELFEHGRYSTAFGAAGGPQASSARLTFGPGVVGPFLRAAIDRGVDIRLRQPVISLVVDEPGSVSGVRLADGSELRGAVVLATSGFDWDPELAERYFGVDDDNRGSVAPRSVSGDGIRMATAAGADIVEFPSNRIPIVPGRPAPGEPGFTTVREYALPHAFVVDRTGRRFANDAVYWEIADAVIRRGHSPCWLIWDAQHHRRYGQGHPSELVTEAATLAELGERLGIDGVELTATAERFSEHALRGEDPEFGRGSIVSRRMFDGDPTHEPNANLGDVAAPPFYGMRLRLVSTGIGLTGVRVDSDARVLDTDGAPIAGLFAVGGCAAFTSSGTGYNSGFSLSRAMAFGYVAANVIGAHHARATATR